MPDNIIIKRKESEKNEIEYDEEGNELRPFKADKKEELMIKELLNKYPNLDYLMALVLIRASPEELEQITNGVPEYRPMTSEVIPNAFNLEPLTEEQIKEKEEKEKEKKYGKLIKIDNPLENILIS